MRSFLTHSSSCREQCSWRCTQQTGWCRRTLQIPPLPIWSCMCLILLWIILIVPKRQKLRNLSERLKNLFWSLFITMIDLITKLLSCRIILSGCINTWHWSDQRLPWRSHQTAFLSDTPSCSLKDPYFNFLKCVGQGSSRNSLSCPQPMSTWTQIPLLLPQSLLQSHLHQILLCQDQAGQTCAT